MQSNYPKSKPYPFISIPQTAKEMKIPDDNTEYTDYSATNAKFVCMPDKRDCKD